MTHRDDWTSRPRCDHPMAHSLPLLAERSSPSRRDVRDPSGAVGKATRLAGGPQALLVGSHQCDVRIDQDTEPHLSPRGYRARDRSHVRMRAAMSIVHL